MVFYYFSFLPKSAQIWFSSSVEQNAHFPLETLLWLFQRITIIIIIGQLLIINKVTVRSECNRLSCPPSADDGSSQREGEEGGAGDQPGSSGGRRGECLRRVPHLRFFQRHLRPRHRPVRQVGASISRIVIPMWWLPVFWALHLLPGRRSAVWPVGWRWRRTETSRLHTLPCWPLRMWPSAARSWGSPPCTSSWEPLEETGTGAAKPSCRATLKSSGCMLMDSVKSPNEGFEWFML